ncbi:flippase [Paraflavitalea soli]|uniref:Flippase n=1 Tax=Paraflavitalea soli TaxID=2315862 RepID=A0A3B7MJ49_9BACT|nr:flippase [Paraflavitalea soli]AXY74442.1 flippase [Paraflavitalea soli]
MGQFNEYAYVYALKLILLASLKRNLVYNYILSASQVLLPIVSIPYVSRILTPEGIGRVSFIDSFTYYFITIAEFGMVVYGMREIARHRDDREARGKLVSELLMLHVVTSAITLFLYAIAVFFAWKHIHDIRLLLFSLSYLLVNFFACEWYFLGMEQFRYITLRSLVTRGLGLVSIFILIKQPEDYYLYYGIIAGAAVLNSLGNIYYLFKSVPVSFKKVNWKKHIAHTQFIWFICLTDGVTLLLDNVFLQLMSTAVAVGYYAFSMKIVRSSTVLLTDSLIVFFPRIVTLIKEGNKAQLQAVISRNSQFLIFFAVPLCAGIFLLAEPLIAIFLGPQFMPVVSDIRILALFPLLRTCNLFLSKQVLIAWGKEKLYLRSSIAGSLAFIVLSLLLSRYWADVGACCAIVAAEVTTLVINYYYARRVAGELQLFETKELSHAFGSALVFIPVIWGIQQLAQAPLLVLLLSIAACIVVYGLVQFFVMRNHFAVIVWEAVKRKSLQTIYNN